MYDWGNTVQSSLCYVQVTLGFCYPDCVTCANPNPSKWDTDPARLKRKAWLVGFNEPCTETALFCILSTEARHAYLRKPRPGKDNAGLRRLLCAQKLGRGASSNSIKTWHALSFPFLQSLFQGFAAGWWGPTIACRKRLVHCVAWCEVSSCW